MRNLTKRSLLAIVGVACVAPPSFASGFIVIDSSLTNVAMLPGVVVPPIHPPVVVTPPVHPPVHPPSHPVHPIPPTPPTLLKGSVAVGLRVEAEDIKVEINDQVAKTYITQTFFNDTDRNLAGTYMFPLPEDTTFSSFSLHIDGKPVEGKILEASEARRTYEEIVRKMVDPGLLEYADYKTVRARIFPIPAHGSKKVELEYTQVLKAENGMVKYRFPLKAEADGGAPIEDVKIDLKISSKQSLRTIWSPSHEVEARKSDDHHAHISFDAKGYVPDKDFMLYFSVSDKDLAANVLTHRNSGEDGYFLFSVTPPMTTTKPLPKDIVLAVDTSGSMQGEKIEQAKKAMKYIVNALNSEDRFGLVQFNTDVDSFQPHLANASAANKKAAADFINGLEAHGGTNIGDALSTGCTMLKEETPRPGYLILMTDGEPTVGDTTMDKLLPKVHSKRDIRVFDFGVGYDVNTKLLNKLADGHHGYAQYVEPKEDLETAMSGFYQKIKSPVLSNVKISFDGIQTKDVYPREVKDIFAGSQVLLIGKYKTAGHATVHLTGSVNGAEKSYSFPMEFAPEDTGHTYLPRLWAMRRIAHLTEVAQENSENREIVDEIVALSKKYGIITAYTSFLVTDPSENGRLANGPVSAVQGNPWRRRGGVSGGAGGAATHVPMLQSAPVSRSAPASAPMSAFHGYNVMAGATRGAAMSNESDEGSLSKASYREALKAPAFADSLAVIRDFRSAPEKGKDAVAHAKKQNDLKSATVAYGDSSAASNAMKVVEDKTFYFAADVWTDSEFSEKQRSSLKKIAFGSDAYFDLLRKNPAIAKYLAVGQRVIFVYKGVAYEITASAVQQG